MRGCAALASAALLLSACQPSRGDFGFEIASVSLSPGYQVIHADFRQQLQFSREAAEALEHGVPLTISIDLELRDAANLTLLASHEHQYTIRFRPLSQHFELSGPGDEPPRTFPRLRHALAELAELRLRLDTGALAPGSYEFRSRTRLDNHSLPAPMRLPVMMSAQWRHDSGWSTWPFTVSA